MALWQNRSLGDGVGGLRTCAKACVRQGGVHPDERTRGCPDTNARDLAGSSSGHKIFPPGCACSQLPQKVRAYSESAARHKGVLDPVGAVPELPRFHKL